MSYNSTCGEGVFLPSSSNENEILLNQIRREIEDLTKTTEATLLIHDGKINEIALYVKNNLSNTLRTLIDSMKLSGELDEIISESISSGLRSIMLKLKDITDYGAKGNGYYDDAQAICKMLADVGYAVIPQGEFNLKSSIKLTTWQYIIGNGNKSVLIVDPTIGEDVFQLTKYNEISNLVIKQTDQNWTGNYFTISSETLESENLSAYENLSIKIHDLTLNTKRGTFVHYWSTQKNADGKTFKTYGLWNLKVYNINHYGQLDYIQRAYTYNHDGKRAWITQNNWENCVFNSVIYGWFGSKNADTFELSTYQSQHFKIKGCTVQALSWSKNLFYFTGEVYAEIYDTLPYDWMVENPNYKPFRIKNENMNGRIMIGQNRLSNQYINWIEFTNPVKENIYTYLGDFLYVDGFQYKFIQKPILLDMGTSVSANHTLFKIATLDDEYMKRNLHFNLYFRNEYKRINFSLVVDWEGKCKVFHDKLPHLLKEIVFVKHGKTVYMGFKYQSNTCFIEQMVYPQEVFRTFLDLHIEKIGDKDTSNYTQIPMVEF